MWICDGSRKYDWVRCSVFGLIFSECVYLSGVGGVRSLVLVRVVSSSGQRSVSAHAQPNDR